MAEIVCRNPTTLYKKCLSDYVRNLNYNVGTLDQVNNIRFLPPIILADIYVKMSRTEHLKSMLHVQLADLDVFYRLLKYSSTRQKLFRCVSSLLNSGKPLATQLQNKYIMRYRVVPKVDETLNNRPPTASETIMKASQQVFSDDFDMKAINFGLLLGSFLSEAGWLSESINILSCVASRLEKLDQEFTTMLVRLDCLQRLLHSESVLFSFKSAEFIQKKILDLIDEIDIKKLPKNLLATVYLQLSILFFARSEYDKSFSWSVSSLQQLTTKTPEKIVIDVLRQAAKSCVVKREFKRANMLISQAVKRARNTFGKRHQKYADALLDYGFFLLNVDTFPQSVNAYKEALDIKRHIFGHRNFHVAIVHEDLAYANYVNEYSTGDFQGARENIEKAIDIIKDLVPTNHIRLASAKRIKALLLEEIALDKITQFNGSDDEGLLLQSEELHKRALQLSLEVFGEYNVQTSKHYGNLGRLYQTMNKFEEAERMHKKAIKIKIDLLGPFDYEVGLSIGHLASLYNYHMKKYREAEELYLRSIDISLRLFGKTYSGLEYDYIGLINVYEALHDFEKYLLYADILENWRILRSNNETSRNKPLQPEFCDETSIEEITKKFFEMCSETLNVNSSIRKQLTENIITF